jgi:hypothetical protein
MAQEHLRCPPVISHGVQKRVFFQGEGLFRAVLNAIVVCIFAGKSDALVLNRPEGGTVVFRHDVNPERTEVRTFPAGDTA